MDLSSEMIHSLLPVFLVSTLGASALTLGLIEGVAESTALIGKVFSGMLSDRFGRRKPLVIAGYSLAAITKPLFALATSAWWVLAARFFDRIGKGIRGSPRDALLADMTPAQVRGSAYGLRQALDTGGALLGPMAAIAFMKLLDGNMRTVFWIAAAPAFFAVLLLVVGVHEPRDHRQSPALSRLPTWQDLNKLGFAFWIVTMLGAVVTLARFSEAFLVLRVHEAGIASTWTPLSLAVMNASYVISSYPAGRLSDRVHRAWLLAAGLIVLIVAHIFLATGERVDILLVGVAVWGLHMGLTQGVFAAMVADTAPADLRGSAFGVFNALCGLFALVTSLLAGALWQWRGPAITFYTGACFSAIALAGLIWWRWRYAAEITRNAPNN
jgi:MFS family permease